MLMPAAPLPIEELPPAPPLMPLGMAPMAPVADGIMPDIMPEGIMPEGIMPAVPDGRGEERGRHGDTDGTDSGEWGNRAGERERNSNFIAKVWTPASHSLQPSSTPDKIKKDRGEGTWCLY